MKINEIKLEINLNLSQLNYFHALLRYIHQETTCGSSTDKSQVLSVFEYSINHSLLNIHGFDILHFGQTNRSSIERNK